MRNNCKRCTNRPYTTPAQLPRYKRVPVKQQSAIDYLMNAVGMGDDLNTPFNTSIKEESDQEQGVQSNQLTPKDARFYSTLFPDMYESQK